jgi:signal transduction histidine kinase
MKRSSLQRRMLQVIVIAAIPAFVAHISFQIFSDVRTAREHTTADVQDVAAAMMPVLKSALIAGDLATAKETLDDIAGRGNFRTLSLVEPKQGHVLVKGKLGSETLNKPAPDWFVAWLDYRFPEQRFSVIAGGESYGILVAEPSSGFLVADLWQRVWTSIGIWLATLVIFLALVRASMRQSMAQLDRLAQAAHRFGAGDLTCRAEEGDIQELAEAAMAFNKMADSLAEARHETEEFQASLERRVQERTSELERANAELEQFAYVASHDLRQPLRMVTSYLGLIERKMGTELTQEVREFMDFAIDGAKKMDALIHDLLEYSRTGRASVSLEAVGLDEALQEALAYQKGTIEASKASVQLQPGLPVVTACRTDIVRLFQNLLGNALKYHQAGRSPEINVTCRRDGDFWEVSVQDNGIGIPDNQAQRIFGIFQRLHADQDYEGTGIGLAICQKIVTYHGGRIWVESEPGKGSIFRFTLPLEIAPASH